MTPDIHFQESKGFRQIMWRTGVSVLMRKYSNDDWGGQWGRNIYLSHNPAIISVNMFRYLHEYNIPTRDSLFSTSGAHAGLPQLSCYSNQLYQPHTVSRKDPITLSYRPLWSEDINTAVYLIWRQWTLYNHSSGWPRLIFGCFWWNGGIWTHNAVRTLVMHKGRKWWESKLESVWRSVVILPYFISWRRHTYTLLFPWIYIFTYSIASLLFPPG